MRTAAGILLGRAARWATRLRGGGSAVPGRVLLTVSPNALERAVERMPLGVVFVSGSNGKSTTTNMLVGILRAHGVDVFSNPSGGNLPQGIASALLASVPLDGRLREQIAVLEVDEAYGVNLAKVLRPSSVLLLNVQIDQLNRFFEPDRVVKMLATIAGAADAHVVVNANDDNLVAVAAALTGAAEVSYFGVDPALLSGSPNGLANAEVYSALGTSPTDAAAPVPSVVVERLSGIDASLTVAGANVDVRLPARGLHYAVDVAGAAAMAERLLGESFRPELVASAMLSLDTVYGRGEVLSYNGEDIEVIMMKNPPSLQLNLDYLEEAPEQLFVAVDEGTPDPSWMYDTDFSHIDHVDIVSGTKAWQLATRFGYGEIAVGRVVPELKPALEAFLALPKPGRGTKTMIVNYEQMMLIRKLLGFLELENAP
ncbi:UDP-N-acetylmuramyl tripeptide synthase [Conyzicola lurida]|uniref:Lipid II isoglutaminyl synthase (glutamine-hydrolyzing) subunit MurT n=1 Tax=Conyzicola lurida TaxID=1172621 RepID=A0A841AMU8_9MICO|nr:UDP-N-acetylmuramyl tripeptide synthase [Conyzicola lurida]